MFSFNKVITKLFLNISLVFLVVLLMPITAHSENQTTAYLETTIFYDEEFHDYYAPELTLTINNIILENLEVPPLLINDYTLVPVRAVFESLGAVVFWVEETQEVSIIYEDKYVVMNIDNYVATVNGTEVSLDQPPKIINDRTMIPVRFVSESIGFTVGWDAEKYIVSLLDERPLGVFIPDEEPQATPDENLNNELPSHDNYETDFETDGHLSDPEGDVGDAFHLDSSNSNIPYNVRTLVPAVDVSTTTIEPQTNAQTSITGLIIPELFPEDTEITENDIKLFQNGENVFVIENDGPISSFQKILLPDNRLIIDINNSTVGITEATHTIPNNIALTEIRFGINYVGDLSIARVAMDLNQGISFDISLSEDRTKIYISFLTNSINNVEFIKEDNVDKIKITGTFTPSVDIASFGMSNFLAVDLPFSTISVNYNTTVDGNFVSSINSTQYNEVTGRLNINLSKHGMYTVETSGQTTIITISQPTYKNLVFDCNTNILTLSKQASALNANSLTHVDDYFNDTYTITFSGDYSNVYGYGEYMLRSEGLHSIFIETTDNITKLTFNENSIMAFQTTEDADNIYIKILPPREMYDNVVVIDAGHGGTDPGAIYYGSTENELNLDISQRLSILLRTDPTVKVYETRIDDSTVTLQRRAEIANQVGDIFISIHNNSGGYAGHSANGTETYYMVHDNDAELGFSSENMANIFQAHLLSILGSNDRKVKTSNLYVLRETTIPAILLEIGFMTHTLEMSKLKTPEYRQQAAEGIYKAILETFSVYSPTDISQ